MRQKNFHFWMVALFAIALPTFLSCEKLGPQSPTGIDAPAINQAAMKSSFSAYLSSPPDIIVTTTADVSDFGGGQQVSDLPGPDEVVSLREAIDAANNTAGPQVIGFNIPTTDPGFDGKCFTIRPLSYFEIAGDGGTTIDGSTQALYTGDTNPDCPEIVIDAMGHTQMIHISSSGNTVHGLLIYGGGVIGHGGSNAGISVWGRAGAAALRNTITGCVIGLDPTGSRALWTEGNGILLGAGADNTCIGGTTARERNVIAGMMPFHALMISSNNNLIIGNYIGTEVTGTTQVLTNVGIVFVRSGPALGASNNVVGGSLPGSVNVIVSNSQGVKLANASNDNLIEGNLIGIDVSGRHPLGNGEGVWVDPRPQRTKIRANVIASGGGHGIRYYAGEGEISNNMIGVDIDGRPGLGSEAAGIGAPPVGGSRSLGLLLIQFNKIASSGWSGITVDGEAAIAENEIFLNQEAGILLGFESLSPGNIHVRLTKNLIYDNGGLGIDIGPEWGVLLNDPGDADTGPNNLMNYPVLERALATPGILIVKGYIDTPNPKTVTIEFFANPVPNPGGDKSGYGEGAVYLGSVRPNAQGKFTVTLLAVEPGTLISATATDAVGNTSEFAKNIEAQAPGN